MGRPEDDIDGLLAEAHGWNPDRPRFSEADRLDQLDDQRKREAFAVGHDYQDRHGKMHYVADHVAQGLGGGGPAAFEAHKARVEPTSQRDHGHDLEKQQAEVKRDQEAQEARRRDEVAQRGMRLANHVLKSLDGEFYEVDPDGQVAMAEAILLLAQMAGVEFKGEA